MRRESRAEGSVVNRQSSRNRWILPALLLLSACSGGGVGGVLGSEKILPVPAPLEWKGRTVAAVWDEWYLDAALELIKGAKTEIDVVHFEFSYGSATKKIQNALADAVKRGVEVRVILDDEPHGSKKALPHFEKLGADAVLDNSKTRIHTKMIVVDRRRVLFGSTNLSSMSILNNHETNLLVDDPELGEAAAVYAAKLREAPARSVSLPSVDVKGATIYFDRDFEEPLFGTLDAAKNRIFVQMYGTNLREGDDASPVTRAFDALVAAKKRGAEVRVILERGPENEWGEKTTELNRVAAKFLAKNDIPVRFDSPDTFSHAKLVIADDLATVGSMNWGYGGFRQYHEMNAVVSDPKSVEDFALYFEALWSQAKPFKK